MKIKEGFMGSRLVVVPLTMIGNGEGTVFNKELMVHSAGYYPNAESHYFERQNGCSEFILIYCTVGEGWIEINGERSELYSGNFMIIPAETAHSYGASAHNPWSIYWVHFKGSKAAQYYQKVRGIKTLIVERGSRIEDRQQIFDELINVLDGEITIEDFEYANLSLYHLLATFIYPKSFRKAIFDDNRTKTSSFINLASHYMHENIDKNITLKEFASYFGYSESHFCRLFYAQTGLSPINYFLRLKIDRCCQLLVNTNLKINQISSRVGFESPLYFSRYFKRIMGVSPRYYRGKLMP